jgi:UDP-N-acetylglucosamine 2-epimerase (non-hydrolysing)
MKILIVIGARPNFMKAAPIISAIKRHNAKICATPADGRLGLPEAIEHVLVHTGQHYGDLMSGTFFRDLDLPLPDVHLGVGSGSHAVQTAEIMKKFEQVVMTEKPDVVIVVGDVNSTIACTLVTAKVSFDSVGGRPLIAHVEAGLRSFDRAMAEEINRILTDHLSDLLFVTEASGLQNLCQEGIAADKIHFVGNTMIDSLLSLKDKAEGSNILEELGLRTDPNRSLHRYALLTLHRPSNVDHRDTFLSILAGLNDLATDCPIIFPVHPRTQQRIMELGGESLSLATPGTNGNELRSPNGRQGIIFTEPLGYLDFLCLMKHAALVVTDSGGIQEETTCLGIPCVTVRENTERPVTVEIGTNTLAGTNSDSIRNAICRQLTRKSGGAVPEKWDGQAARRIVEVLVRTHAAKKLHSTAGFQKSFQPDSCMTKSTEAAVAGESSAAA